MGKSTTIRNKRNGMCRWGLSTALVCCFRVLLLLTALVGLSGCLDAGGGVTVQRMQNYREMIDLIDITLEQKKVDESIRNGIKAQLLEGSPADSGDSLEDGRSLLVATTQALTASTVAAENIPAFGGLLATRLSALAQKQVAAAKPESVGIFLSADSSHKDIALDYAQALVQTLLEAKYDGASLIASMKVVYARIKKGMGAKQEKALLGEITSIYIVTLESKRPAEAELFQVDRYRDTLKQAVLGHAQVEQVLGEVMSGEQEVTILDTLIEALTPIDTILNGDPGNREELLYKTSEKPAPKTKTPTDVIINDRRTDTQAPSGQPAEETETKLDPPDFVSVSPAALYKGSSPECVVEGTADHIIEYRWVVSKVTIQSEFRREFSLTVAEGELLRCEARYFDGTRRSEWVKSLVNEVRNTAPTVGTVHLSPLELGVAGTATCLGSDSFSDVDGDEITTQIRWYVNGGLLEGETQNALVNPAAGDPLFEKGDEIYCTIKANDGQSDSAVVTSSTISVVNTPPTVGGVGVFQTTVTRDDTVTCDMADLADDDGDTLTPTYRWTKNGATLAGETGSTLQGVFVRGDTLRCYARVSDGTTDSSELSSNTVTVVNSDPVFTSVITLYPPQPTMLNDLTCSHDPGSDVDGDTLVYDFEWFVNDTKNPTVASNTLQSVHFDPGDKVLCRVTARDGFTTHVYRESAPVYPTGFGQLARYGGETLGVDGNSTHLYVAKGSAGLEVYSIDATTGLLTFVTELFLGKRAEKVTINGTVAAVIGTPSVSGVNDSIYFIDISDPANPSVLSEYTSATNAQDVEFYSDRVYVADGTGELQVINVSDISAPAIQETIEVPTSAAVFDVKVTGTDLVVATSFAGIYVYDVSNPAATISDGNPGTDDHTFRVDTSEARAVWVDGSTTYLADYSSGIRIISHAAETIDSTLDTTGNAAEIAYDGTHVFYADSTAGWGIMATNGPGLVSVSTTDTEGLALDLFVQGQKLYVADGGNGILVYDVSTPASPVEVQHLDAVANARHVVKDGRYLYVADEENGLVVIDVNDPTAPQFLASLSLGTGTGYRAYDLTKSGNTLFIANSRGGLRFVDVTDPSAPALIAGGSVTTTDQFNALTLVGTTLYAAEDEQGVRIFDVSNPAAPSQLAAVNTNGTALGVTVQGNYLFVADGSSGVVVFDVSDLGNIVERGSYDTAGIARHVEIVGNVAVVSDEAGGVLFLDITATLDSTQTTNVAPYDAVSNPTSTGPRFVDSISVTSKAYRTTHDQGFVYVATYDAGLLIINYTDPSDPRLQFDLDTDGRTFGLFRDSSSSQLFLADGSNGIVILGDPGN